MIIPKGKQVRFAGVSSIEDYTFVLEEDVTFSFNSNFDRLVGGSVAPAFTLLGETLRDVTEGAFGFSGQFKEFGFQQWTGTDPASVSFTIGLYMKTNAYEDVILPAKELIKLPLPADASPNSSEFGLIAPGPSLSKAVISKGITCYIGNVALPLIVVKKVEPTVSKECDQNDYPIWIKLRIDIDTVWTATTDLIDTNFWPET